MIPFLCSGLGGEAVPACTSLPSSPRHSGNGVKGLGVLHSSQGSSESKKPRPNPFSCLDSSKPWGPGSKKVLWTEQRGPRDQDWCLADVEKLFLHLISLSFSPCDAQTSTRLEPAEKELVGL